MCIIHSTCIAVMAICTSVGLATAVKTNFCDASSSQHNKELHLSSQLSSHIHMFLPFGARFHCRLLDSLSLHYLSGLGCPRWLAWISLNQFIWSPVRMKNSIVLSCVCLLLPLYLGQCKHTFFWSCFTLPVGLAGTRIELKMDWI